MVLISILSASTCDSFRAAEYRNGVSSKRHIIHGLHPAMAPTGL